jgi:ABC-type glutathione transport system ATPase component
VLGAALAILGLLGHTGASVSGRTMLLGRDLMDCDQSQMREVEGGALNSQNSEITIFLLAVIK